MHEHYGFYQEVLQELLDDGTLRRDDAILVVCAGPADRDVLHGLGFTNVTLTNLSEAEDVAPFVFAQHDAENLGFDDGSFDVAIVHSGLHHLRCPARGITEMIRVARKGILGFEPHRSWFTALGVRLGFGQRYELAAVNPTEGERGGVADSGLPNYVARFCRADVEEIARTSEPIGAPRIRCWYRTRMPRRLTFVKNPALRVAARLSGGVLTRLGRTVPTFANNVAFYVAKPRIPEDLFPWLRVEDGRVVVDRSYLRGQYDEDTIDWRKVPDSPEP